MGILSGMLCDNTFFMGDFLYPKRNLPLHIGEGFCERV